MKGADLLFHRSKPHSYVEVNDVTIDAEEIRRDLIDDVYALAAVVIPAALGELPDIAHASAEEIIRMACGQGIDLNKYRAR